MLRRLAAPVDLVLADPPYSEREALAATADLLSRSNLLLPSSVVVLEHAAEVDPPGLVGELPLHTGRTHGRTRVSMYAS
jgi:16S rRNA G966 N2-methylase RsmD